ncbi:hypothetical protein TIFTF001_001389 [Ficus carica]|uniref:Uncharacterized protein n=1 Tax=Ficus carica TaxID=3494 RepID=A0AA87Z1E6_FICCA|nr:hypothetical protein TIFTF001_001389 [Ficus carica]
MSQQTPPRLYCNEKKAEKEVKEWTRQRARAAAQKFGRCSLKYLLSSLDSCLRAAAPESQAVAPLQHETSSRDPCYHAAALEIQAVALVQQEAKLQCQKFRPRPQSGNSNFEILEPSLQKNSNFHIGSKPTWKTILVDQQIDEEGATDLVVELRSERGSRRGVAIRERSRCGVAIRERSCHGVTIRGGSRRGSEAREKNHWNCEEIHRKIVTVCPRFRRHRIFVFLAVISPTVAIGLLSSPAKPFWIMTFGKIAVRPKKKKKKKPDPEKREKPHLPARLKISSPPLSFHCRPIKNHKKKAKPRGKRNNSYPIAITLVSLSGSSRALDAIAIWFFVPPSGFVLVAVVIWFFVPQSDFVLAAVVIFPPLPVQVLSGQQGEREVREGKYVCERRKG